MYMIKEHRLFNRNFKVKIRLWSNPTTTRFSYYFLLLTLPKGASNKIMKTNIEMDLAIFVCKIMKRYQLENYMRKIFLLK